jgi:hypothetical protein
LDFEEAAMSAHRSTAGTILLSCLACYVQPAAAFNVYKVDKDCVASGAYATIQEALDIAALSFGTDYVWISNNHAYPETLFISDQDVIIEGGFTDCNDNDIGPADRSYISGLDSGISPVLTIAGNSHVYLSNLSIAQADNSIFEGGGIRFTGQGSLTLSATDVQDNKASRGAGIYFSPQGGPATLTLLDGTDIYNNTASDSGGGIYLAGQARLFVQSLDTAVGGNRAVNYGGGIDIHGPARADIGSPGLSNSVVNANDAQDGGGIAVRAGAVLRVFAHDSLHPSNIAGNTAVLYGGGLYVEGDVCLFNPAIFDNDALQGAAIFQTGAGGVYFNAGFPTRLGSQCGPESVAALGGEADACADIFCNSVSDNMAQSGYAGLYGAIIYAQGGDLIASRLQLQYNVAGSAIQSAAVTTAISTSLVTDNFVSDALVNVDASASATASFTGSTFAHNTIDGAYVFKFAHGAAASMTRDIIAQPSRLSASTTGPLVVNYTMSNDISTLPHNANPTVVANDPLFADAAIGDYHLRAASPAVDFAPAAGGIDLDSMPRDVDLPQEANKYGPTDLGAYELQVAFACDTHADALFCDGFGP